ncbi:hypothetical protein AVEN_141784-1 [Araneus ventricosus]|uniref:C2H2-type domain-containing protein n=1 Tax=Araneus ventricosus TaxID=182803 RepID=A0A4Y2D8G4_ARAVE|nr:hypothetical protein AVEN_141784-1 [Araneus ventricosus]
MATAGFECKYCSMWFRTKIGLGVHEQSQHRAEYQDEIQVPKPKTRWCQEELAVMAMQEAILISQGNIAELVPPEGDCQACPRTHGKRIFIKT